MCRLLVDCDDNTTSKKSLEEPEETEEGEESAPLTSSPPITAGMGTVAMARCWRDIVHLEVSQVLKKFDCTDSPHTVASDVLNMYDQLKQAMSELFGGHSQFALALKEGFSKAFQSLDEVTGVRVSEGEDWRGKEGGGREGGRKRGYCGPAERRGGYLF